MLKRCESTFQQCRRIEAVPVSPGQAPLNLAEFFGAIEARCGLVEGAEEWAAPLDHYLYGAPKRGGGDGE